MHQACVMSDSCYHTYFWFPLWDTFDQYLCCLLPITGIIQAFLGSVCFNFLWLSLNLLADISDFPLQDMSWPTPLFTSHHQHCSGVLSVATGGNLHLIPDAFVPSCFCLPSLRFVCLVIHMTFLPWNVFPPIAPKKALIETVAHGHKYLYMLVVYDITLNHHQPPRCINKIGLKQNNATCALCDFPWLLPHKVATVIKRVFRKYLRTYISWNTSILHFCLQELMENSLGMKKISIL